MPEQPFNRLFLCTGNSARGIIAESLVDHPGRGRFNGYSAGSYPSGEVNPLARRVLEKNGYPTGGPRSKSRAEFSRPGSPLMDLVFTVCDRAAAEICPVWPGRPANARRGIADPAAVDGPDIDRRAAFQRALDELHERISLFVSLPFDSLDRLELERQLEQA